MPLLFPFEGCHVEVLSTLGVRYQGVLKSVNGENKDKSITLTNVHHFGSETRVVEGVAPIPAKGALPTNDERCIYAIYIHGVKRVSPPPQPPRSLPSPLPANSTAPQLLRMAVASGEAEPVQNGHDTSAVISNPLYSSCHSNAKCRSADGPSGPTYFLAQHHNSYFTGILTSAARHPSAPVYVGFDAVDLARIATPRIGQLWEAPNCEWTPNGQRFVNEHYVRGRDPKGIRHFIGTHGMPWINDHHINQQAKARHNGLRLIADAEVERRWGKVAHTWVDLLGKRYITVANLRDAIDGVEILVEAAANGGSRSESAQFKFYEGDEVEVEMVRLAAECWVGQRFVLPNLDDNNGYHDERPPFCPDTMARSLEFLKRSRRGDYFPVGVRPASSKPVYFIAQRLHDMAIGVLLKEGADPWAPIYVAFPCADPIHGEVVRPGQKWLLPIPNKGDYSFICNANPERSIMPRINGEEMLNMDAELNSQDWMELVKSPKMKVRKGRIKRHWRSITHDARGAKREDACVEVAARGTVSGVQLNRNQFDGLYADFLALSKGDRVEVEMVRLEEGCWVGPNYLLPDIYGGADQQSELRKMGAVRARSGDYLPMRIRKPQRSS